MNPPIVYQPDSVSSGLQGLWSLHRTTQEALSLRDYLAARPGGGGRFQCHDLPSALLPGVSGLTGAHSAAAAGGDLARLRVSPTTAAAQQQSLTNPSSSPRLSQSSSPTRVLAPASKPPPLLLLAPPYVEALPPYPKAVAASLPPQQPPSERQSFRWAGEPRLPYQACRQSSEEDAAVARQWPPPEPSDTLGRLGAHRQQLGDRPDASARQQSDVRAKQLGDHVRWSPDDLSSLTYLSSASSDEFLRLRRTPTTIAAAARVTPPVVSDSRHSAAPAAAHTRSAFAGRREISSTSPFEGPRSFPDFVRDTIANLVHRSSPEAKVCDADDETEAERGEQQAGMWTDNGSATLWRPPQPRVPLAAAPQLSPAAAVDVLRQQPTSRKLRDLLCGVKVADHGGGFGNAFGDVRGVDRKRKAHQPSAGALYTAVDEPADDDGPLDLSKKHCPVPPPRQSSWAAAAAEPACSPTPVGSPVVLAKKNLHPVTSRVSDCLLRSVQKAARITSALEGVDEHDKATLVCSSWHRLLLWLLAEENFTFVVVPMAPGHGRSSPAASHQQSQNGCVSSSSSGVGGGSSSGGTSAGGANRPAVPTVGFVRAVTSFIDKCHGLKLDRVELDLLFAITLFHLDGQHSCSSTLADRLISQTRRRLMDELLRHTTASATGSGDGVGGSDAAAAAGGIDRYSQLLLCLPALYAIDVHTFEVLFCERLTGPAVDMRLLLMDIIRPLLL